MKPVTLTNIINKLSNNPLGTAIDGEEISRVQQTLQRCQLSSSDYSISERFDAVPTHGSGRSVTVQMFSDPGGGTLGISGWGCAAGTLEPLTYTRASSAEFCYPILD